MKIGFPNNPRKNIISEIEWIGRNNFDFVDLFLEEDEATPEKININKVSEKLNEYDLSTVGHTAWYLPFGSPVKSLRKAAIQEARRYFEILEKLETRFVTIHSNWPGGMFSAKEGVNFQIDSLSQLVSIANEYNLQIMYEPVDSYDDHAGNVAAILKAVPGLYLHIDIGHANLFSRKPEHFIKEFHEKLKHIHLHDNTRNIDLHLPMGCGIIDWDETIKALKRYYDGTITLEIFSRDRDYVLLSRDKLLKYWSRF